MHIIALYFVINHNLELVLRFLGCKRFSGYKQEQGCIHQFRTDECELLPHRHFLRVASCRHCCFPCAHNSFHGVPIFVNHYHEPKIILWNLNGLADVLFIIGIPLYWNGRWLLFSELYLISGIFGTLKMRI